MSLFTPEPISFAALKDKVVVLTGGCTGIGAATVELLSAHGAQVVFGDTNTVAAQKLCSIHENVTFVPCDVLDYSQMYDLFRTAYDKYGKVDHAISCAGIFETGAWFNPELSIESVRKDEGDTKTLDVNLYGTLKFARIAAVFLREGKKDGDDRSLTLVSSVNAFRECPGLVLYQASKHGVQGILRSARKPLFEKDGIRVNAINPGATETAMTAHLIGAFKRNNLYWQSAESVATIILGLQSTTAMHGKAIYIEGGEGWEIEESFEREQPRWLGEEPTRRLRINAEAIMKGALLSKD